MTLPYTIVFIVHNKDILLLRRNFPPNQYLWNGVGGKIEAGELPLTAARREILEETGFSIAESKLVFGGIVTWTGIINPKNNNRGMYSYVVRLTDRPAEWIERPTEEGLLAWKPLEWVFADGNGSIPSNIPHFLPPMLANKPAAHYRCHYNQDLLQEVNIEPLQVS